MTAEVISEARCREIVEARSKGVCEFCFVARATEMCHRKPRSQGGKWEPSNIYHGCAGCHRWETSHPVEAHRLGFRLWRGEDPLTTPLTIALRGRWLLTNDGRRVRA